MTIFQVIFIWRRGGIASLFRLFVKICKHIFSSRRFTELRAGFAVQYAGAQIFAAFRQMKKTRMGLHPLAEEGRFELPLQVSPD